MLVFKTGRAAQKLSYADFGDVDVAQLISAFYDRIEVHTRLGPPVTINLKAAGGPPDPATDALLNEIKPALVFRGNAGSFTIAPKGMPDGTISKLVGQFGVAGGILLGGAALLLLGIGFGVGYYTDALK